MEVPRPAGSGDPVRLGRSRARYQHRVVIRSGSRASTWAMAIRFARPVPAHRAANAVNFTDGLDGLVAGSGGLVFGAFVLIAFWQSRNPGVLPGRRCRRSCRALRRRRRCCARVSLVERRPGPIIHGGYGSQAIGGALAAMALLTNTQLLLILIGGLYMMTTVSVDPPGLHVPCVGKANLQDGADPPSLRAEGLAGDNDHHPFLDPRRARRRGRCWRLLRRLRRSDHRGVLP